jgi:AcrR family transcriptional regulator
MTKNTTQQTIIVAARRIVQRDGVAHLTIEAVAREAGLSKGGVLYHFPTKDSLIEGMITSFLEEFELDLEWALTKEEGPGRWLRAYVRSCQSEGIDVETINGLIAALATNQGLLEPLRQKYSTWQSRVESDGLPPALATVLRLAMDGLWFADLFGLAPPSGKLREEVISTILTIAETLA